MLEQTPHVRTKATGDTYSDLMTQGDTFGQSAEPGSNLDGEEANREFSKLMSWFLLERDKQSANRHEMALDQDFYDNMQWDPEDAQTLRDRGQMPLVYNEVAPMVDWLIGTERRARVDWKVFPRTEDDVEMADTKTKVLKFVSDINRVPFTRSRSFADAIKVGVGWLDDGVRDDPTQDILFSKYEDWRNVLWDSASYDLDLGDARYLFRWRWVDEDIAELMFPDRIAQIRAAIHDVGNMERHDQDDVSGYYDANNDSTRNGSILSAGTYAMHDAKRNRAKLIECQYRKPTAVKIVADGPLKGQFVHEQDMAMKHALAQHGSSIIEKVMMRTHFAVFTEASLISMGASIYRHNRFSLTPIWCYRRGKDRLPYGAIRRVRDIQQDLNKRASKALFLTNTNQIIADEGAVDDWNNLRDEADRPDGMIIKKAGKEIEIRRDQDQTAGQINMMTLAQSTIQRASGISNENLGRQTNATSGIAIQARQLQGSVVTTEPFDNLRLAIQVQGEKQLSLTEQFYTEEKVVRLTGARGAIEWVKINTPELQPDGTTRYMNDITATAADFVVSEQDYNGTIRQVMFEQLGQMAQKMPPEISLRLLRMAMEFSDLPNKDEIADQIRQLTGEQDPSKEMTPEQAQQAQQQMQQQAEALDMQRKTAMLALEEQSAKVKLINAQAEKMLAEAQGGDPAMEGQIRQVQTQAAQQIEQLSTNLRKAQTDLANRTMQINKESDIKLEVARIDADTSLQVAEIQARNDTQITALEKRMEAMVKAMDDRVTQRQMQDDAKDKAEKAKPVEKPAPTPVPAPAPVQAPAPVTVNLTIDNQTGSVKKEITVERDKAGNITGAKVNETKPKTKKDA